MECNSRSNSRSKRFKPSLENSPPEGANSSHEDINNSLHEEISNLSKDKNNSTRNKVIRKTSTRVTKDQNEDQGPNEDQDADLVLRTNLVNAQSNCLKQEMEINRLNTKLDKANSDKEKFKSLYLNIESKLKQEIIEKRNLKNELENVKAQKDNITVQKDLEIQTLRDRLSIIEEEITNSAVALFDEPGDIDFDGTITEVVYFDRTSVGCVALDSDKKRWEFIQMIRKKAEYENNCNILRYLVKSFDNRQQFIFGVIKDSHPVKEGDKCIVCHKAFENGRYGSTTRTPYGIGSKNVSPILVEGSICGYHHPDKDREVSNLNLMIKKAV